MKQITLSYKFVDAIPQKLEERTLYIAMEYATAVHRCCCGCGREVVTPFSPTDWKMAYDGVSVSLSPSIGNWSFDCQSHYWIEKNAVRWAARWSKEEIDAGRACDRWSKEKYYDSGTGLRNTTAKKTGKLASGKPRKGLWAWLSNWWSR